MVRLPIVVIGLALLIGGCSTTSKKPSDRIVPESEVVEVDPDKVDHAIHGPMRYEPTPDHVVVGQDSGIIIEVQKREVVKDEQLGNIQLQRWDVTATNTLARDRCVTPMWRLMDFEYMSNGPSEQFVPGHSMVIMGEMQQRAWIIDGVPVAPPPSGYLADLRIRDPVPGAKQGDECSHIADEADIVPEDEIVEEPDYEETWDDK